MRWLLCSCCSALRGPSQNSGSSLKRYEVAITGIPRGISRSHGSGWSEITYRPTQKKDWTCT